MAAIASLILGLQGCVVYLAPPQRTGAELGEGVGQVQGGWRWWLLVGVVGVCWLGAVLARARGGGGGWSREELGLLRTARDALRFVIRGRLDRGG